MKKITLMILFLLTLSFLSAQQFDSWQRVPFIEEYFKLFEVEVDVWYDIDNLVLNFEDTYSRDFNDMLFQLGYLMTAFNFMLEDSGETFSDMDIETIIYSYFTLTDPNSSRYYSPNEKYEIWMTSNWLNKYFYSTRAKKQEMLYTLFEDHYSMWFPELRQY